MTAWFYKWLPIFFGCHCRKDRSFHFKNGRPFPICARCTGELIGMLAGIIFSLFFLPPLWIVILVMLPMVVDGFIQLKTVYESTNFRRVLTGILFGYSLVTFLIITGLAAYQLGAQVGTRCFF